MKVSVLFTCITHIVGTLVCLHSHIVRTRLPYGDKCKSQKVKINFSVKTWFKVRVKQVVVMVGVNLQEINLSIDKADIAIFFLSAMKKYKNFQQTV